MYDSIENDPNWVKVEPLTKREQFAMAAMQGAMWVCDIDNELTATDVAEQSVRMADALLKELSND